MNKSKIISSTFSCEFMKSLDIFEYRICKSLGIPVSSSNGLSNNSKLPNFFPFTDQSFAKSGSEVDSLKNNVTSHVTEPQNSIIPLLQSTAQIINKPYSHIIPVNEIENVDESFLTAVTSHSLKINDAPTINNLTSLQCCKSLLKDTSSYETTHDDENHDVEFLSAVKSYSLNKKKELPMSPYSFSSALPKKMPSLQTKLVNSNSSSEENISSLKTNDMVSEPAKSISENPSPKLPLIPYSISTPIEPIIKTRHDVSMLCISPSIIESPHSQVKENRSTQSTIPPSILGSMKSVKSVTGSKEYKPQPGRISGLSIRSKITKWLHPNAKIADAGKKMEAYYDEILKRWIFPGDDPSEVSKPISPPPTTKHAVEKTMQDISTLITQADDPLSFLMAPPPRLNSAIHNVDSVGNKLVPPMSLDFKGNVLCPSNQSDYSSTLKEKKNKITQFTIFQPITKLSCEEKKEYND